MTYVLLFLNDLLGNRRAFSSISQNGRQNKTLVNMKLSSFLTLEVLSVFLRIEL
jgi:hypothetical protein